MSRVDDLNHLGCGNLLVACWHRVPAAIGVLPSGAQWKLHRV